MTRFLLLLFLLLAGAVYSVVSRKLTMRAALTGIMLALFVYEGSGFTGIMMMACFFLSGSAATSWKLSWKRQQGLAESEKGTRTAMQVLANAGTAALIGLVGFVYLRTGPWYGRVAPSIRGGASSIGDLYGWTGPLPSGERLPILPMMIAGAFAAATADTLSSELGNLYGRRYYNILNFKSGERGRNGMVSLEGTLCGLGGSVLIAVIYAAGFGWNVHSFLLIVLAGTIGNIADSYLGATLERKNWIGNDTVNFINTAIAASLVLGVDAWLRG